VMDRIGLVVVVVAVAPVGRVNNVLSSHVWQRPSLLGPQCLAWSKGKRRDRKLGTTGLL
jgi:hypothetical protein